ncbi:MAG: hypothetical protein IJV46_05245 [Acidaminococcaceae bacterium]|nr:hypothetical protein [Acidaminococcaceae bacterium]
MSNTIRVNESAPVHKWLTISNQGTDCLLDLLIYASEMIEQTKTQKKMISFLKQQKDINDVAPGTAGFDIGEMPWERASFSEDIQFLFNVIEMAKSRTVWEKLPYEPEESIVLPWLEQFADMVKEFMGIIATENYYKTIGKRSS